MSLLPDLSRFELQVLKQLWTLKEANARDLQAALDSESSYSTVRKILERLEGKGAVERVRVEHKAWIYRPTISQPQMVQKEVRRFLDSMFDGVAGPLMTHLADMNAVTMEDLQEAERILDEEDAGRAADKPNREQEGGNV